MTLKDRATNLWHSLREKPYRDAFVSEHINSGIAVQIRENRSARGLTQKALGGLAGMGQVRISKLENPDTGTPNLTTLVRLASAFDCALMVRFVPFSELTKWSVSVSDEPASVPSYDDDSPSAAAFSGWSEITDMGFFQIAKGDAPTGRTLTTHPKNTVRQIAEATTAEVSHQSARQWRETAEANNR